MTHFHPVLSTDICLHVEFWWPECRPSSGLCQVVLWWLLPGASSTSQSPSTRGRSTLKDVLLGMFPTKFDMVHESDFFFIEVHDYVIPSIPANIVYVTGHGNIYCVSFSRYLGFLEYGSVLVISRHHKLLRNRFWQLMPDILEQRISCPTE